MWRSPWVLISFRRLRSSYSSFGTPIGPAGPPTGPEAGVAFAEAALLRGYSLITPLNLVVCNKHTLYFLPVPYSVPRK